MSATAVDILRDQAAFVSQRFQFDNTNQRIAELLLPASALFLQDTVIQGQRKDQFQFDSTGALALTRFSAAVESILCPRTQQWHTLTSGWPELDKLNSVKRYCEAVTDILFKARYSPRAGFTYASGESFMSLGAFGNACIFLEDDVGRDLRYQSLFVGDIWVGTDHFGRVDRVHRKFTLTARQAMGKPEWKDKLPDRITKAAEKNPEQTFEFIHCVKPRKDYDTSRIDYRGMRFASYYLVCGDQAIIEEGGYRTMPYLFSRFMTAPRETYGRGPASMVLNTLNGINEKQKTMLRAGQRAVDPPLMTVDDDALEAFNMKSNAMNRGWLNDQGQPQVVPFQSGANLPIGLEMVQDDRAIINDAFFVTLFQILVEQPAMTATEALLRAQEKGELLGPSVGRQQSELLDPMIERELDILSRVPGLLPEMPPELVEAGGFLGIKYTSPLDRLQKSGEGASTLRWLESAVPLEQLDPGLLKRTADLPAMLKGLADIQGVPAAYMLDDDQTAAESEAQAAQMQAQQLLAAAPVAGKAAVDIAKAQQLASATPSAVGLL